MALWFCIGGLFELGFIVIGVWVGGLEGVAIGLTIAMTMEAIMLVLLLNRIGTGIRSQNC